MVREEVGAAVVDAGRDVGVAREDEVLPERPAIQVSQVVVPSRVETARSAMVSRGGLRLLGGGERPRGSAENERFVGAMVFGLRSVLSDVVTSPVDDRDDSGLRLRVRPDMRALMMRWWELLHFLRDLRGVASWQLRLQKPRGTGRALGVVLIAHTEADSDAEARGLLDRAHEQLAGALLMHARFFEWSPMLDADAAAAVTAPFAAVDFGEVLAREELDRGGKYQTFPFRLRPDDMGRTVEALSLSPAAVTYAVTLAPCELTAAEAVAMSTRQSWAPAALQTGDRCFEMRVHLASDAALDPVLIHAVGHSVAGYEGRMVLAELGPLDAPEAPRGGFDFHRPSDDATRLEARLGLDYGILRLWHASCAPAHLARLRHLVDPIDATTAFRVPAAGVAQSGRLSVQTVPGAPLFLPASTGAPLGTVSVCGRQRTVRQSDSDSALHTYVAGKTGTGKSTLLLNLALERIREGHGLALIDPHGDVAYDLARRIPPERVDDAILFDPTDVDWPIGLNLVEYDRAHPEQKSFFINELLRIFSSLYAMDRVAGPIFEQYFRNAFLALMDDPEGSPDVTSLGRFFRDRDFRRAILGRIESPLVRSFWLDEAEKVTGDNALYNMAPYITSKLASFTSNDFILPIVAQPKSGLDFRAILDERKILIVRLNKGRLGALNTRLVGMVLVMRLVMAAMSRSDLAPSARLPFHLIIDEFQNLVTPSLSELLAEARKYALRLTLAHQHAAQLDPEMRASILGNVGTTIAFRVSPSDAALLAESMTDPALAMGLVGLPNYRAVLRLHAEGRSLPPFTVDTLPPPPEPSNDVLDTIIAQTHQRYARPRADVLREVYARFGESK